MLVRSRFASIPHYQQIALLRQRSIHQTPAATSTGETIQPRTDEDRAESFTKNVDSAESQPDQQRSSFYTSATTTTETNKPSTNEIGAESDTSAKSTQRPQHQRRRSLAERLWAKLEGELEDTGETKSDAVILTTKSKLNKKLKRPSTPTKWEKIDYRLKYERVEAPEQPEVATLAHGLDRVLFNPGVHYLKDPRTREFNFTPFLEYTTQPANFDYDMLTPYKTSSKDTNLLDMAQANNMRYIGSTSSVSSILSQFYFLISHFKPVNTSIFSETLKSMPNKFTRGTRTPASVNVRWKDGVYAIDADKTYDIEETVLSVMGKSMEKMLTLEPAEYERYLKDTEASPITEVERSQPETYAYGKIGQFLLRSQLDCQDPRLPRKTFDLKTRATVPIRLDISNYKDYLGYSLRRSHGLYESFEREYFDMLRSAFLKYSFQVRIGHMDGILVAYHNTWKLFGFQYISREEMDARLFGNSRMGSESFHNVLLLFHAVLDKATKRYPNKSVRITVSSGASHMDIFVEQLPDDDDKDYGADAKNEINSNTSSSPSTTTTTTQEETSTQTAEKEDQEVEEHHIEDDDDKGSEFFETKNRIDIDSEVYKNPMTHYTLATRSFINDIFVEKGDPIVLGKKTDVWKLQYNINEVRMKEQESRNIFRAMRLQQAVLHRRQGQTNQSFINLMKDISNRGLEYENMEKSGNK
ncbi:mitochondrial protein Pet127-domain-containing protein [Zychaea mexicana]|uniref:mitochondrial protein Pet127-domain-containing protein n=1 Tax=Zychaea mexicana TaxID=64656 RepID=UPI0022FE3E81|nr:mitochondrial protein Pet127-domain-containing protein [Zychaea mexicana]KAI9482619.1 mitochondrial protein Pet127-domain-containing protein [Zychaea mexicana]